MRYVVNSYRNPCSWDSFTANIMANSTNYSIEISAPQFWSIFAPFSLLTKCIHMPEHNIFFT